MLKLATAFSGIGAVEHALNRLEIEYKIEFACDNGERKLKTKESEIHRCIDGLSEVKINKYITNLYNEECGVNQVEKTYRANYPIGNNKYFQDVRFLDGNKYKGKVDLFVGGSPCQSFSIMGKRKGLEEARGTLFYEYARLVKEIQPKVFIYENVTGMLNHDAGRTWKIISSIFDDLGYQWTFWTLNAKDYGLPQNRKRIFVVGYKREYENEFTRLKKPKEEKLEKTMNEILEKDVDNQYYLPKKGYARVTDPNQKKHVALNGTIARCQVACQQYNWYGDMRFENSIPKRLMEDERIYKGFYKGEFGVTRCLTPRECLRLMGFDDEFKIVVNNQNIYRQVGNSIAVDVLMKVIEEIMSTNIFE